MWSVRLVAANCSHSGAGPVPSMSTSAMVGRWAWKASVFTRLSRGSRAGLPLPYPKPVARGSIGAPIRWAGCWDGWTERANWDLLIFCVPIPAVEYHANTIDPRISGAESVGLAVISTLNTLVRQEYGGRVFGRRASRISAEYTCS